MNYNHLILISFTIIIFIILYIEPMLNKNDIESDNEYGSARFATDKEIKKNFKKEKIRNIKENGVPILFDKKLKYMWVDRETPHYVYIGSTGSGKSVTAVIPFCTFTANAKKKRSVFITDPKGEIYNTTSKMFKDNGYNILTIDFRNPELSNKFNILEPIIKEYEKYMYYEDKANKETDNNKITEYSNISMLSLAETNRMITSLSAMIMSDKVAAKDPFWNNAARNLLEGLIAFFLEEYKSGTIKRTQITMNSIRKFQNSSMEDENFHKFKTYISNKKYGIKSKDSLTSILTASDNTLKSITSTFGEKMAIFDDINVANVTSQCDFDIDTLGRKPTALYVIVPDEDKVYFKLITIIVGLIYKELVKLANTQSNKKLPVEIDWILDEFANCPPLSDIESIVSVSRSRGMRFHFFIQSFSQLDNVYGKDIAQIILDNAGLCYLKTNTMSTADTISKMLGRSTIKSKSISKSSGNSSNTNQSISLMGRELMTPDEIKQLHYKTIIFPIIGYPILRSTVMYSEFDCYVGGEIQRISTALNDLQDTYFTVEQLDSIKKDKSYTFDAMNDYDIQSLEEAKQVIMTSIKKNYEINYKIQNGRTYLEVMIKDNITQKEKSLIKAKINNKKFHLVIISNQHSTVIEVHNKNMF